MLKEEILEILESYPLKKMIQIGNVAGGIVVTVEFAIDVIDYIVEMAESKTGFIMELWP